MVWLGRQWMCSAWFRPMPAHMSNCWAIEPRRADPVRLISKLTSPPVAWSSRLPDLPAVPALCGSPMVPGQPCNRIPMAHSAVGGGGLKLWNSL
jgi:hypothetical protein